MQFRDKKALQKKRDDQFFCIAIGWGAAAAFSVIAAGFYDVYKNEIYARQPLSLVQIQQRFNAMAPSQQLCLQEQIMPQVAANREITHLLIDLYGRNCQIKADVVCAKPASSL